MSDILRSGKAFMQATFAQVLLPYAQIYFSKSLIAGLLFLFSTMVSPFNGIAGLLGLLFANGWAWMLRCPRSHLREGYYGFNGLLVGLATGLYYQLSFFLVLVIFLNSLLMVVIASIMKSFTERHIGVPVLSWPFVIATWITLLSTSRFTEVERASNIFVWGANSFKNNEYIDLYLESLGATFFQQNTLSGLLVFLGLFYFSRWATLLSIIGFFSGFMTYRFLGGTTSGIAANYVGFNFILTAIALGGTWIVLSPSSLLLATAASAVSAILCAAIAVFLQSWHLPILAAPFVLTTQLFLFTVYLRSSKGRLKSVIGQIESPEENLTRSIYRDRRYSNSSVPCFFLPVLGRWKITQGYDGSFTHKAPWQHGVDFEVYDDKGKSYRSDGLTSQDYFAFGAPVLAPADGKVIRIVSHLEDNPIGEVDTKNNWGNLVIIWHATGIYSALCHLQRDSIIVKENEAVVSGQVIGRVGNSGRSPIPHLHYQLQASTEIGSPTLYGEFRHYQTDEREDNANNRTMNYITQGVPKENASVASMVFDPTIKEAVGLTPGKTWRWNIRDTDRQYTAEWKSEIDSLGNRTIAPKTKSGKISFYSDQYYTTMLEFSKRIPPFESLFYIGVPRVPHIKDHHIRWEDYPCPDTFIPWYIRPLYHLALPFLTKPMLQTLSSCQVDSHGFTITTRILAHSRFLAKTRIPSRIDVTFKNGTGPYKLQAYQGKRPSLTGTLT